MHKISMHKIHVFLLASVQSESVLTSAQEFALVFAEDVAVAADVLDVVEAAAVAVAVLDVVEAAAVAAVVLDAVEAVAAVAEDANRLDAFLEEKNWGLGSFLSFSPLFNRLGNKMRYACIFEEDIIVICSF